MTALLFDSRYPTTKVKSKVNTNINVKGSGQECPLYTNLTASGFESARKVQRSFAPLKMTSFQAHSMEGLTARVKPRPLLRVKGRVATFSCASVLAWNNVRRWFETGQARLCTKTIYFPSTSRSAPIKNPPHTSERVCELVWRNFYAARTTLPA
jgi:hypothetical protein